MRGLNFTKLGEDIVIIAALHFISEFKYLAASSKVGGSKLSDVENDANFRTLTPFKNKGRVGEISEISIPIAEALPTTEPPEYI